MCCSVLQCFAVYLETYQVSAFLHSGREFSFKELPLDIKTVCVCVCHTEYMYVCIYIYTHSVCARACVCTPVHVCVCVCVRKRKKMTVFGQTNSWSSKTIFLVLVTDRGL